MGLARTLRLTLGDYDLRDEPLAKVHCVSVFFTVAADAYPKVFDDFEAAVVDGDVTPAAVRGWAARHGLRGGVVESTAVETALIWRIDPDRRRRREWSSKTLLSFAGGRPAMVPVDAIRPDPLNEHRDAWLARAAATWDAQCALLRQTGFERARVKSSPEHFTWLADRVIGLRSFADIARREHKDRKTVSGAIHELAAFIGIVLPQEEN